MPGWPNGRMAEWPNGPMAGLRVLAVDSEVSVMDKAETLPLKGIGQARRLSCSVSRQKNHYIKPGACHRPPPFDK
jgi:hypothetical protein